MQSFWKSGIYVCRDSVFSMDIEQLIERGRQVLLNPMEIHIEGNLQYNRYDWQKGKGTDDVEQTLWQPNTLVIPHNLCKSVTLLLP